MLGECQRLANKILKNPETKSRSLRLFQPNYSQSDNSMKTLKKKKIIKALMINTEEKDSIKVYIPANSYLKIRF